MDSTCGVALIGSNIRLVDHLGVYNSNIYEHLELLEENES